MVVYFLSIQKAFFEIDAFDFFFLFGWLYSDANLAVDLINSIDFCFVVSAKDSDLFVSCSFHLFALIKFDKLNMKYIELRSDVVIVPTTEMRQSILTSPYGDWSYGEDDTVKELETYAQQLFGSEAAAFTISTTMSNQCALLTAGKPGQELLIREQAHILKHENGSPGRIARLMTKSISIPFGYMTPEILKKLIRKRKDNQSPRSSILVLEYPTFQGVIPPLETIEECSKMARAAGMHVHIDGARFFTAIAVNNYDPKDVMKHADSIAICLSKGLLAPLGSVTMGSKAFISNFKLNQKMMGGIIRKPGVVARTCLIGLQKMRHELIKDIQIAKAFAERLKTLSWIEVLQKVQTNMVYYRLNDPSIKPEELLHYLFQNGVMASITSGVNRLVIHHYIREPQIQRVIDLLTKWYDLKSQIQEKEQQSEKETISDIRQQEKGQQTQ